MIAKLAIAVAAYIAIAPHAGTMLFRVLLNALAAGGIAGLVGTATRLQPASMIPENALYAGLLSAAVTAALHVSTKAMRAAFPKRPH